VAEAASDLRFDLAVATVDRTHQLGALLDSLDAQTHRVFRLVVVDQNDDDRVERVLAAHPGLDAVRLRSVRGLSRARNAALPALTADLVAFPDDDCVYPPELLERVARRFAEEPSLDGLTGRAVDRDGRSEATWKRDAARLTDTNLWNRAISYTIFLQREVVARVGPFDEQLGLGSGNPWSSGEEIDYLVRAIRAGARIEYDPSLTVIHEQPLLSPSELQARGYRNGASLGYVLREHRHPKGEVARRLVRPIAGVLLSFVRLDFAQARFHVANLRGRIAGYLRLGQRRRVEQEPTEESAVQASDPDDLT
jgi:glycosyltransferase involved in cell wall biosynthesis